MARQFSTVIEFIQYGKVNSNTFGAGVIEFEGFNSIGDGGATLWQREGTTGLTPSKTPTEFDDNRFTDAVGDLWVLVPSQIVTFNGVQFLPIPFGAAGNGGYYFNGTDFVFLANAADEAAAAAQSAADATASAQRAEDAAASIEGQLTTTQLIASSLTLDVGDTIQTNGFLTAGDGGGAQWLLTSETGTPSQTPADLGEAKLTDSGGRVWSLVGDFTMLSVGAIGDGVNDDSDYYYLLAESVGSGKLTFNDGHRFKIYHSLGEAGDGSEFVIQGSGDVYLSGEPDQTLRQQQPAAVKIYKKVSNSEGGGGILSMNFNGDPSESTMRNLSPFAVPDNVAVLGYSMRGVNGSNPIVASNFHGWFENNDSLVWVQEIDVQNEGATQTANDDSGGVGIVVNTGSTFSPSTGISIRRQTGAGTAPGFLRGIQIRGARDTGIEFEAMSASTYPDMNPQPNGKLNIIRSLASGDVNARYTVDESGRAYYGSGSAPQDIYTGRSASNRWSLYSTSGFPELSTVSTVTGTASVISEHSEYSENDAGSSIKYSFVRVTINSSSAGAESATRRFYNKRGGSDVEIMQLNDGLSMVGTNPGSGNIAADKFYSGTSQGATGSFTSSDGKTITVTGGIITSIV
ncbi:hypothetical protein [Pseudoalteromonas phage XCL1123]|nr:hypothetical protein [Pseudoalteromonas phage XCL1123]